MIRLFRLHSSPALTAIISTLLFLFISVFFSHPPCAEEADDTRITIERTIRHLASLGGRGFGTEEGRAARDFIASRFKEMGLESVSNASFQPFTVTLRNLGNLSLIIDGKPVAEDDFVPLAFTAGGKVRGETVYAGYGMNADDYKGVAARGKVVVALAETPVHLSKEEANEAILQKCREARRQGARALILLDDKPFQNSYTVWPDRIPPILYEYWKKKTGDDLDAQREMKVAQHLSMLPMSPMSGDADIPVVMVSRVIFDATVTHKVALKVEIRKKDLKGNNVVGLLRGTGPRQGNELLIIGAHYDHLGKDAQGKAFPGADDNASGIAALLETAQNLSGRSLSGLKSRLKRDILFIAFDGEEWGLRGSMWYADHPLFPLEKTVAMLNMDTVGRNKPDEIYLIGARQDPELFPLVVEVGQEAGLLVLNTLDFAFPWGSDHYAFHKKGVPAVDLSSSLHEDYHKISDTADRVDSAKVAKVSRLATRLALRIAESDIRFPKPQDVVVPYPSRGN